MVTRMPNKKDAIGTLATSQGELKYYRIKYLEELGLTTIDKLPFTIRILLENALRNLGSNFVTQSDLVNVAKWDPYSKPSHEFPLIPGRVLMQDFTGVPAVVDLAAMRSAIVGIGGDPSLVNPIVPVDLVIDHSVQVDHFGNEASLEANQRRDYERNRERYTFLRWAQNAFKNFRVVPPGMGIVHQINLEYLAEVVTTRESPEGDIALPDTVLGTDSHTTMINGLSVLGWGVGGIEAEAVLLGQPYYLQIPEVVGCKLSGALSEGVTATDLVLTLTQMLRSKGVVEKFVEFYGPGLPTLSLPDRATIANMAPEYGATCGFFPTDEVTVDYLRASGRSDKQSELVEMYAKAQGLFNDHTTGDPIYSDTLELNMSTVEPSLAGPRRPQDRVALGNVRENFRISFGENPTSSAHEINLKAITISVDGKQETVGDGMVAIAAITSCTNTSNPSVMIGAGLLARNAINKGLSRKPWVKTSMAPGSRVVTEYMAAAGVTPALETLGFHTVGYGCTTCIGNSGPLIDLVSESIHNDQLVTAAVLSGNRNFEGRVHPDVRANYLASPMLVVAYALAGTVDIDLTKDPIGSDENGNDVYLVDIWPNPEEISNAILTALKPETYTERYTTVFDGPPEWNALPTPTGELYEWDESSTYIREVPFFGDLSLVNQPTDIEGAKVLVLLGDSVTTDHISPAGSIPSGRPAGQYLIAQGVEPKEFNTFGARRGNHEVMVRGTFGNVRLKNKLTPELEGDFTIHQPTGDITSIYETAMRYQATSTPTIIIAGKEYGTGSSRDWAAKGPNLLGVKVTLAESYERIHRSNLVGMGILPIQFKDGESAETLGLTGLETYGITGISEGITPNKEVQICISVEGSEPFTFSAIVRIDNEVEVNYYYGGGVLQTVLRQMAIT